MHRRGLVDIANRAIKNYKIAQETLPNGRFVLTVSTLEGVAVERIEAADSKEAEHHLRDMGYERIPSYVAFEIDDVAR
jgi:hypothetical protein